MATSQMSKEHKAAMAQGRANARVVKAYLDAIDERPARRNADRTEAIVKQELRETVEAMPTASSIVRLQLTQRRLDLEAELEMLAGGSDLDELEAAFVEVAATYAAVKGIGYSAWREMGVEAEVLKRAGITRSRAR